MAIRFLSSETIDGALTVNSTVTLNKTNNVINIPSLVDNGKFLQVTQVGNETWEFKCESLSGSLDGVTIGTTPGKVAFDENGQIQSIQLLDVATAGGRLTGFSNRGYLSSIHLEQTATNTDGGYIRFLTAASGTTSGLERFKITETGAFSVGPSGTNYGTSGQVLTSQGNALPTWTTPTTGTITGSGVDTQVSYWTSSTNITGNNDFIWNNTNKDLTLQSPQVAAGDASLNVYGYDGAARLYTTRAESGFNTSLYLYNQPETGAGTGTGIMFRATSDTSDGQQQATIYSSWTTNTHASRTAKLVFQTTDSTTTSDKMTILGNGNVGIGVTDPDSPLEVSGGTNAIITLTSTTGTGGRMDWEINGFAYGNIGSGKNILGTGNSTDFIVYADSALLLGVGSEDMRITSAGNVGIGTTAPDQNLTVKAANAKISAQSTADGQIIGFQARYLNHTTLYGSFEYHTGDAQLYIDNNFQGNNGVYSNIRFRNCPNGSSTLTDRMIIQGSTGNVGIGTTSPYAKLDVVNGTNNNEAANATDFRFVAANRAVTTERANMEIYTNNAQAADLGGSIGFGGRHTDSSTNDSLFATIKSGKENATSANYAGYLSFGTAKSDSDIVERMRITSGGVVQCGLSTASVQSTAKLSSRVNGSAIEFGHTNTSDKYFGTLGSYGSNGSPFISFSCWNELSANTWTTKSTVGNIISGDLSGNLCFQQVTSTNSTGQTPIERMRIDSSGNLLVGKTANAIGGAGVVIRNAGEIFSTRAGDVAGFNRLTTDGNIVQFYKDGSVVGVIGTQNWGIGTTSPQQLLHLNNSSGDFSAEAVIRGSTSTGTPKAEVAFKRASSGDGATLVLRSSNPSGTIADAVIIDTSQNVGIGTASPGAKLEVRSDAANPDYGVYFYNSGGGRVLKIYNTDWDAGDNLIYASNGGTANPSLGYEFVVTGNAKVHLTASDAYFEAAGAGGTPGTDSMLYGQNSTKVGYVWNRSTISTAHILFGTSSTERMRITSAGEIHMIGGNVGIGTTAPSAALDISGASTNQIGAAIINETSTTAYTATSFNSRPTYTLYGINTANTYVGTRLSHAGNTEFFQGIVKGANNGEMEYVWQGYNGTAYQQFGQIDCYGTDAGTLTMAGDVVAYSDKKLKKNIKTLDGSKVYNMRGVSFTRKDTGKEGSGVIAQEIQEIAPELIKTSNDGTLGVAYGNLTGYLIEAIKEQQKQIDRLEEQIKKMSSKN